MCYLAKHSRPGPVWNQLLIQPNHRFGVKFIQCSMCFHGRLAMKETIKMPAKTLVQNRKCCPRKRRRQLKHTLARKTSQLGMRRPKLRSNMIIQMTLPEFHVLHADKRAENSRQGVQLTHQPPWVKHTRILDNTGGTSTPPTLILNLRILRIKDSTAFWRHSTASLGTSSEIFSSDACFIFMI